MLKNRIWIALPVLTLLILPAVSFAVLPPPPGVPADPGENRSLNLYNILDNVISIVFYILMFAAILFILVAAFNYLTAGGDPEKVGKAQNMITYAAVAIVVAVLARSIPFIIRTFILDNVR